MELIQKYKLALLQLQEYSDNELIIQEVEVLNITSKLEEIKTEETEQKILLAACITLLKGIERGDILVYPEDETNFDYKEIENLFFFKSGRWDIQTYSGILIKLPKKNLKDSLDLSFSILNDNRFEKIKILDIRQSNQVIING